MMCSNPYLTRRVFKYSRYEAAVVGVVAYVYASEGTSVEAVEAVFGGKPHESLAILQDAVDGVLR